MYEIGRLCVKLAGRDARLKCVIVDVLDNSFVLIDGQTRRRKCNVIHLEPLSKVVKIKKGASHADVVDALKKEGIEVLERKTKETKQKPAGKLKAKKEKAETDKEGKKEEKAPKKKAKKESKKEKAK